MIGVGHGHDARQDHLLERRAGRDVDDAGVVRALACNP